jgi:hypothetical protein
VSYGYKTLIIEVYVPDDVDLDDSAIDAIESAAGNEAFEQVQAWAASNGSESRSNHAG